MNCRGRRVFQIIQLRQMYAGSGGSVNSNGVRLGQESQSFETGRAERIQRTGSSMFCVNNVLSGGLSALVLDQFVWLNVITFLG